MNEAEFRASEAERAEMAELSDRFEAAAEQAAGAGAVLDKAIAEGRTPHPGKQHEFRTTCRLCGEPGTLFVAILGPDEAATIAPIAGDANREAGR